MEIHLKNRMTKKPPLGTYPNKIAEFMERADITQMRIADVLGLRQPTIQALINGQTRLSIERAQNIAPLLQCKWWELSDNLQREYRRMQNDDEYKKSMLNDTPKNAISLSTSSARTLPVYGAKSGAMGVIDMINQIDRAPIYDSQKDAPEAYGVYAPDNTMSPSHWQGDLIRAIPYKPPATDRDCVIHFKNDEGIVRIFKGKTATHLICQQLSPNKEVRYPLSDIKKIDAVVR